MISFRHRKTKVRVVMEERISTPQDTAPLYAEGIDMLDGFTKEEVDHFLEEHPTIVPLFEIDVITAVGPYVFEPATEEEDIHHEPNPKSIEELRHARGALECELAISQCVKASTLEEINKLLRVGFIRPIKRATWLSLIMVVPKKNGKIRVCVDYRKLNAATITEAFPLPFIDGFLDVVAGHEMYYIVF